MNGKHASDGQEYGRQQSSELHGTLAMRHLILSQTWTEKKSTYSDSPHGDIIYSRPSHEKSLQIEESRAGTQASTAKVCHLQVLCGTTRATRGLPESNGARELQGEQGLSIPTPLFGIDQPRRAKGHGFCPDAFEEADARTDLARGQVG